MNDTQPTVGLFATCLVDLMRPSVGFAAAKLLKAAGCAVTVPQAQTCCGQPAYNSGDARDAADIARQVIRTFEEFDYVVVPSGSCGGQIKVHYPQMLAEDAVWGPRARALADKTHELLTFLADVRGWRPEGVACAARATYHDSCAGLRELGIKDQPRALLAEVRGLEVAEGEMAERCCGFGGLFSVKYPEISTQMADEKCADVSETGADLVLGGDLGCLLNVAGRLQRQGSSVRCRHAAEVLAGMADGTPAIGEGPDATDPDERGGAS
jgi:L-lactate dehydrogenase complex protein LldE